MLMRHCIVPTYLAGLALLGSDGACGQNYPDKPIRMYASEVGGSGDFVARMIAQGLSSSLGQQIVVDNRGPVGAELTAKARPDGYTLLFYGPSIWLLPFMRANVPYDPVKDFSPIALAVTTPTILVVHPSLPVKTVKELVALAKAKPGQLNYGTTLGGSTLLASELFKSMAGVDIVQVSYRGNAPALNALLGGEVQVMFPNAAPVIPHIKLGRLRALAVTTAQPSALIPGLSTVAAAGLPGYEAVSNLGMLAPAGTPATIIGLLNKEILRLLNQPEIKQRFLNSGVEPVGSSPEQFATAIKSEMDRMGKVIKDAGIRAD